MSDQLRAIGYKAEAALLELADLLQSGPVLRIVHRFWVPGTECLPGEEVWSVAVVCDGRETNVPLSLSQKLLLNHLAETRHVPQSATQIVAGIRQSPFYAQHGMNGGVAARRKISRSAIKEYVKRLRLALGAACKVTGKGDKHCADWL